MPRPWLGQSWAVWPRPGIPSPPPPPGLCQPVLFLRSGEDQAPCGRPGVPPVGASKPCGQRPRPTTASPHRRRPARARHPPPDTVVATVIGPFSSHSAPWWWLCRGPFWRFDSKSHNVSGLTRVHFWMADCCCGCCPLGMLAAMAVMTMTTGGGGGSAHQLATGGTEGHCPARPFFYLRRRYFSHQTKEPTLLTMEGMALKSSGATVLASSPTKPPSISKAFLPLWLTVHHWRALRASACLDKPYFWWGCRIMFPLRMLAAHYERVLIRSLSAPATSCLTTLGCALARMHMTSACLWRLQGITPRRRRQTRRCLAVAAAAVVLCWPRCYCCCCGGWQWWRWVGHRRLTPAAQFPATMARASGRMKPLVLLDSPYALPSSSSEWPPRGEGGEEEDGPPPTLPSSQAWEAGP